MHRLLMLSLCAALVSTAAFAQAPTGKVTVVTSFAKDVTDPVKKAFEAAVPGATLEVQNRNTNAGVKYLEETKSNNQVDLFWASAPDAFEVLKGKGLLQKYAPKASGIPEKIGQFPINDPAGFYFGFAASGYGIMWNERYVKANKLPDPKEWQDLARPVYFDHVSIAAPSRSGTTHLTIEAVLQGEGWAKGWGTIKAMAGNFRNITERSFGVPEAVNSGQVGYGIVIDFFAFSAQASGFPVKFIYPTVTTIVPANVGIVANAPNKAAAEAFVEFLLSPAGQQVLFDQLISFQLDSLKAATKAIHEAETALARKDNAQARALVGQARELIAAMPLDEATASAKETASAFTGGKQKGARQAELEQQWAVFAKERYAQAQAKAEEAAKLAK